MGSELYYVGSKIHRVVPKFMLHGGDISIKKDGKGGKSIYKEGDDIYSKDGLFEDENVWFPHSHKGVLSMNNTGKNTNGSQFMISLRDSNEYFDEKHTVFGRVISGW
jgi:cyclophilin family peptidyl-prolyl cis-trans isomerase